MKISVPRLLHRFFRKAGIRIDLLKIQKVYSRHPLPHSLRSLSDTLDALHVSNMVCRLEFGQLFEIEGPFIAVVLMKTAVTEHPSKRKSPTEQLYYLL